MNAHEMYSFDINGYLVVPQILSREQVAALNEAIDHNQDHVRLREGDQSLSRNSPVLTGTHGRGDIGGILTWPEPWCRPFRDLLSHLPTMRYMLDLCGDNFQYGNANGISMTAGAEGCTLHGGDVMRFSSHLYRYHNGRMWNSLVGVCYQLADVNPGDGGFVCIPGSHKANFDLPEDAVTMESDRLSYHHVAMKAGDALIFTEAMTHGSLPWTAAHERRTLLYRYAAGMVAPSRGIVRQVVNAPFLDELTPLQRAIMEPPYNAGRPDVAALIEAEERVGDA